MKRVIGLGVYRQWPEIVADALLDYAIGGYDPYNTHDALMNRIRALQCRC